MCARTCSESIRQDFFPLEARSTNLRNLLTLHRERLVKGTAQNRFSEQKSGFRQRTSLRRISTGRNSRYMRGFSGRRGRAGLTGGEGLSPDNRKAHQVNMYVRRFATDNFKPGTRPKRSGVTTLIHHFHQDSHFVPLQDHRWTASLSSHISF